MVLDISLCRDSTIIIIITIVIWLFVATNISDKVYIVMQNSNLKFMYDPKVCINLM